MGVVPGAAIVHAENLWELIDGAADGFVTYGVQEVVTADYAQAGTGYEAVIEVYQMKDPLNAYGKYSEERNPEYAIRRRSETRGTPAARAELLDRTRTT